MRRPDTCLWCDGPLEAWEFLVHPTCIPPDDDEVERWWDENWVPPYTVHWRRVETLNPRDGLL